MTNAKKLIAYALARAEAVFNAGKGVFCNIAEGTHAGSVTMTAGEDISSANVIVKVGENEGEITVAGAGDRPLGICTDSGAKGDRLAVSLPGCAESTFMCRAASEINAGDALYITSGGKVSAAADANVYKAGVALCSASTGGVVEVDPVGFGERAYQVFGAGTYLWATSTQMGTVQLPGLKSDDIVLANLIVYGGSEKNVRALANADKIMLTLDAAGTSGTTKVSWIAIRKN